MHGDHDDYNYGAGSNAPHDTGGDPYNCLRLPDKEIVDNSVSHDPDEDQETNCIEHSHQDHVENDNQTR